MSIIVMLVIDIFRWFLIKNLCENYKTMHEFILDLERIKKRLVKVKNVK